MSAERTKNGKDRDTKAKGSRKELLKGLNQDLAAEFQAVIMYRLFASLVTGPYRGELQKFFEAEIPDELGHAQFLTDKIISLGGTPTSEPAPVTLSRDNREMFEIALKAEMDAIARYTERMEQAEALGEIGLKVQLEDLIVDETNHKEEIEKILTNWRG